LRRRPGGERDPDRARPGRGRACRRAARTRAPPAGPRGAAGRGGVRMTPPPRSRGREPDPVLAAIRRKRRERTRKQRKRFTHVVAGAALATLIVLVVTGFTGAAVWMSSCDLNSLRPVDVGQNSFVYAADGSLLGSIPA